VLLAADPAAFVCAQLLRLPRLDPEHVEPEALGRRLPAGREQDPVGVQLGAVGQVQPRPTLGRLRLLDLDAEAQVHPVGAQHLGQHRRDRRLLLARKLVRRLDQRDRAAEPRAPAPARSPPPRRP
jgi:hypothetical protein